MIRYTFHFKNKESMVFEAEIEGNEDGIQDVNETISTVIQEGVPGRVTLPNGSESVIVNLAEVVYVNIKELK